MPLYATRAKILNICILMLFEFDVLSKILTEIVLIYRFEAKLRTYADMHIAYNALPY